jgi:hypothetical protein
MTTVIPVRRSRTVPRPVPRRPRRDERPRNARSREVRARRELGLLLAAMERDHVLAAGRLEEFDAYLTGVRRRLKAAGYLRPG